MSNFSVNIFLPAAGLGERLRPITNHLPKPLLPIVGKPLIEIILEKLTSACAGRIGINLHWKPELIREWANQSPWSDRITFFPEDPILGTGGALKNAEAFLIGQPFIVHNSDIRLDIDFSPLIETHLRNGNIATLVTHRHPALSNVVLNDDDLVVDVENPGDSRPDPHSIARKVAYTGIAIYSPEILSFLPAGVSHATIAWIAASKAGHRVQAFDCSGAYWNDIGTPRSYAASVLNALNQNGETVFLSPSARCGNMSSDSYCVLESGCEVNDGAFLRNCIVMPGARVAGRHENRILGPDYEIALSESDMQPSLHAVDKKRVPLKDPLFAEYFTTEAAPRRSGSRDRQSEMWSDAILIGLGGSDRRYFRVRSGSRSAVLMECKPDDQDYDRHLAYTEFFGRHSLPIPALLAADAACKRALFEDLGDTSLYSYMKLPRNLDHIEEVYRAVLDVLILLHTRITAHVNECRLLESRVFDYDHLRWETGYFLERFVRGLKGLMVCDEASLDAEFLRLAQTVDAYPKVVIHRDFQCQNIMIRNDSIPRVIDFQGARMAPAAYDIASMLWDPYHRLDDGVRESLVGYYIGEMKRVEEGFNEQAFQNILVPCRLQRHMQALGAYGFLSEVKGKKYFLKHVPEALRLLKEDVAAVRKEYPVLHTLVSKLVH